jgi:hypothetical protein
MLAIIRGLEEWRHYLEGARHPVEIWTDHKNLEYFRVAQKLNRRQARWSLYLSRFDFTLHHKPGRSMGKPDALSRRADHGSGQGDNDNLTLLSLPFRLEADGSGITTGAVLSQQSVDDNAWQPVAFLSKALNPVEHNYEIHDTEMLAIIRDLEEWKHYLEGARHPVEIWTDHKNLDYFRVAQKLNHRQARWSLYLLCFDFTLHHKPGRSMGKPDALSRRADHGSGQGDNDNLTLLALKLFRIHVLAGTRLEGKERNILREVRRSLRDGVQEEAVAKAARELGKDKGRGTVKSAEWLESDGLLMFHSKIYVPNDRDLQHCIIEQHHDTRIAGL